MGLIDFVYGSLNSFLGGMISQDGAADHTRKNRRQLGAISGYAETNASGRLASATRAKTE